MRLLLGGLEQRDDLVWFGAVEYGRARHDDIAACVYDENHRQSVER